MDRTHLCLIVLDAGLLVCAGAAPGSAQHPNDTIIVATNTATPALAVFYAKDRGWFAKAGLHVKLLVVASVVRPCKASSAARHRSRSRIRSP